MPINITQGNTAEFIVEFLDSNGNLTIPSGGTILVSYSSAGTFIPASQSIVLVQNGSFFTGTWASSVAALGLVPWSVFVTGSSTSVKSDTIRVIGE